MAQHEARQNEEEVDRKAATDQRQFEADRMNQHDDQGEEKARGIELSEAARLSMPSVRSHSHSVYQRMKSSNGARSVIRLFGTSSGSA